MNRLFSTVACCSVALALLLSACAHAELRIIGVRVTKPKGQAARVSIYSAVAKENRRDISVAAAQKILAQAEGWGSSVEIGIVANRVPIAAYLPLLQTISKNGWLELTFIQGRKPDAIQHNIIRMMKEVDAKQKRKGR